MVGACLVAAVVLGACGGTEGGCGASSERLEPGEARATEIAFTNGGWDVVDEGGVTWSADIESPPGAPGEGSVEATVELIEASFDDEGALVSGSLSVDLGELGTYLLVGPVGCD